MRSVWRWKSSAASSTDFYRSRCTAGWCRTGRRSADRRSKGDRQSGGQGLRQLQAGHRRIVGFDYPILGQVGDRRFTQRHAALQSKNIHPFFAIQQEVNHFRRRLRVFVDLPIDNICAGLKNSPASVAPGSIGYSPAPASPAASGYRNIC